MKIQHQGMVYFEPIATIVLICYFKIYVCGVGHNVELLRVYVISSITALLFSFSFWE